MGNRRYENYYEDEVPVLGGSSAVTDARSTFIRKTYAHLCGAVFLFVGCLTAFTTTEAIARPLFGLLVHSWWMVLGAFMLVSWIAQSMAQSRASAGVQYMGLGLYAVAEAVIFTPLLFALANMGGGSHIIAQAAVMTLMVFGGLTAIVMFTKSDFSFLGNVLWVLSFAAMGLIVLSMFLPITLGTWFVVGMVVLMSGFILYETSNIVHHYPTDMHVAAALALFSSLATLFWYMLRLAAIFNSDD